MKSKQSQERFFDRNPGLYPWPNLLIEEGFNKNYKPRDVKFNKYLDLLGMKKKEKVLDIGCGTGVLLARIVKSYGVDGFGVDISKKSIDFAKSLNLQSSKTDRLHFQKADATKLPFKNESFDHVLSFDALEHVRDQKEALSEMVRVLKPSGSLLIYTINKHQRYTWNFWLDKLGIDIYERVAHDPDLFLDPRWVKKELERRNINIEQLELFNSFFTLAADEVIMIFLSIYNRLNLFSSSSRFNAMLGRLSINIANIYSHLSLAFLELLETPWKRFGYSNSFFVLGRKVK